MIPPTIATIYMGLNWVDPGVVFGSTSKLTIELQLAPFQAYPDAHSSQLVTLVAHEMQLEMHWTQFPDAGYGLVDMTKSLLGTMYEYPTSQSLQVFWLEQFLQLELQFAQLYVSGPFVLFWVKQ